MPILFVYGLSGQTATEGGLNDLAAKLTEFVLGIEELGLTKSRDVSIFFQSGISVGLLIAAAVMLFISLRLVRRTEHRVNELEGEIPLP